MGRKLLIAAGILVLLGAISILLIQAFFPTQRLAKILAEQVHTATGRQLSIHGPLSLRLFPSLLVVAEDVHLANAPWGTQPDMANLRKLRFEVSLAALLDGKLDIRHIDIEGTRIFLESNTEGVGNWILDAPGDKASSPASTRRQNNLSLASLRLKDVLISNQSDPELVRVDELTAKAKDKHFLVAGTLAIAGQHWSVRGEIGGLDSLAGLEPVWPFDLQLANGKLTATAQGKLDPGSQAGDLQASIQGEFAGQSFQGKLALLNEKPRKLTAQLSAKKLDLGKVLPEQHATGEATPPGLFSPRVWTLPTLPPLVLDLQLNIAELQIPSLPAINQLQLQAKVSPAQIRLDSASGILADGQFKLAGQLNPNPGEAPRFELSLEAKELSVDKLLTQPGRQNSNLRHGNLRISVDLTAQGLSAHALASSAHGQVLLEARNMIVSTNSALPTDPLAALVRTLLSKLSIAEDNRIKCAVMRLPLKAGVAEIDRSIALESDQINVATVGRIDLGSETLALVLRPTPRSTLDIGVTDFSGMVRLDGPIRHPQIGLDAGGTLLKAANVGALVATGGISILAQQRLLKESKMNDPCQRALTGQAKTKASVRSRLPSFSFP